MATTVRLPFETDIFELEDLLLKLELESDGQPEPTEKIRRIRKDLAQLKKHKYSNLSPWETVLVARHPDRPQTMDYVKLVLDEFVELHGDRAFGDDRAIRTGFAQMDDQRFLLVGHQKGHTLNERRECMYGCAHPEGYRKAIKNMRLAAKYNLPVVSLIDTPGAFPGIGSEERGVAQLIATALLEMSQLPTPIICVVIGEGGSGGALGIGIGDKVAILEHAYYSVISPEGCAGILWKVANEQTKPLASAALKFTSRNLLKFGIVDDVLPEPLGGAHRDPKGMAATLKSYLARSLRELQSKNTTELLDGRYAKFRAMGAFQKLEAVSAARAGA
ncbi:MAG: acetyl-CoA carboxylase carboxyltransferase subunit alpha [Planctomycetota bacterium]|nr:acetyl-CoA carboxylase carboxyltransferase subunit alpha [Planctomycetota bacterium]